MWTAFRGLDAAQVRHAAACSLRDHYIASANAALQAQRPCKVIKPSDPVVSLLDRKPKKQKGRGKGAVPARFQRKIQKLEQVVQRQTDSLVLLQTVAASDLLHQADGFLQSARLVQKAASVFFQSSLPCSACSATCTFKVDRLFPKTLLGPGWQAGCQSYSIFCFACGQRRNCPQKPCARLWVLGTLFSGIMLALFGASGSISCVLWKCIW